MNATAHNSLTAGVRKLISYMLAKSNTPSQEITPSLTTTEHDQPKINENTAPAPASFTPDTTKSFVLKDAVIDILLTEVPEITKYHEHKGGISSKNLRELIKAYYGKTIGLFEISKLLMLDKTFQSVGKGCYVVNEAAIPHSEPESEFAPKDEPVKVVTEPVPVNTQEVPTVAEPVKTMPEPMPTVTQTVIHEETTVDDTVETKNENKLTIEPIIAVIRENYDNLQYEDGFGAYEVKTLLLQKGYNGLQIITIATLSDLQMITAAVQKYCQIDDDMIAIISK